jgi:hypothetical protein
MAPLDARTIPLIDTGGAMSRHEAKTWRRDMTRTL